MLNLDFSERVVIETDKMDWVSSPSSGVHRKPLSGTEREDGHATSIVRFDKNSSFKPHVHPLGEEIIVLEGVFSDEFGDYEAGTYIRNPPSSVHAPFSDEGCTLFVKLEQFSEDDTKTVRINTNTEPWASGIGGLQVMSLHEFKHEHAALVKWPAKERFQAHTHFGGEEVFVLSGEFKDEHGNYPQNTWIRSPHMSQHFPFVEEETLIWVKTGHLG